MYKVITYGTFDCLHIGHVQLLRRAADLGDKLYVGVSTDKFNEIKGKKSFSSFAERSEIVSSIRFVDVVFAESTWEQKIEDIANYDIDIFVMGDDWRGHFDDELGKHCEVVYLPRTPGVSSSEFRRRNEV